MDQHKVLVVGKEEEEVWQLQVVAIIVIMGRRPSTVEGDKAEAGVVAIVGEEGTTQAIQLITGVMVTVKWFMEEVGVVDGEEMEEEVNDKGAVDAGEEDESICHFAKKEKCAYTEHFQQRGYHNLKLCLRMVSLLLVWSISQVTVLQDSTSMSFEVFPAESAHPLIPFECATVGFIILALHLLCSPVFNLLPACQ